MAIPQSASILRHLRQTVLRRDGAGLTDGQLLRSFLYHHDETAFEALVRRHGPMVRGVCRRILRDSHDADDAFQAVFLVLLRKASTLATREVVGDWLHGVAYRTALKARAAAARRRLKERQTPRHEAILDEEVWPEWRPLLDQEIARLPEKYRLPIVLCDLEGRTRREAARQLGWLEGTLSGRLSRARAMLARRLTRRGFTLSAAALAAGLASEASARLSLSLVDSTCKAAMMFAAGSPVPVSIATLTEGVVKAMLFSKVKKVVALATAILVLTAGVGAWRYAAVAGQAERQRAEPSVAGEKFPPPVEKFPKVEERRDEAKLAPIHAAKRFFRIDLNLTRERKDGLRQTLGSPRQITLEGREAQFGMGDAYDVSAGGGRMEKILMGPSIRATIRSGEGKKVRLDMTVSQPTLATFDQDVTVESRAVRILRWVELGQPITVKLRLEGKDWHVLSVRAAIQEAEKESDANTIAAAEKDLKMAEFYRQVGHPDSARFYYELIRRRYPGTLYAERAAQRWAEHQPGARVGQIFIIGNKKIADEIILAELPIFPGQALSLDMLRRTKEGLSHLTGLKSNPKVTVIDREGGGAFKDIQITVEEK